MSEAALATGKEVAVRVAVEGDVPDLVQLYSAAGDELAPLRGGRVLLGLSRRHADIKASFSDQLGDPGQRVVIAFAPVADHLEPVGYGTCAICQLAGGELLGSIEELYVMPEARRQGVARAMTASLAEWCSAEGCKSMDAKALPGSRTVKSFFESEGFTARLLIMHRRLD